MGVNNRARRAAKRRKRAHRGSRAPSGAQTYDQAYDQTYPFDERAAAMLLAAEAIEEVAQDPAVGGDVAALLSGPECAVRPLLVAEALESLVAEAVATVVAHGWTPFDLAQIVRRRLTVRHLPAVAAALVAETARHSPQRVTAEWRADLAGLGRHQAPDLTTAAGLELAMGLCGLLARLPALAAVLPPPGSAQRPSRAASRSDSRQLARVRALLAKAESTEYDEEAETLSAKAQELISRYALERLLDERRHEQPVGGAGQVAARRVWIDAPYVMPKAMLIDAVAAANRCTSVITEHLGFSTVMGAPDDLDAVELLATSLLVQADTALLRRGRHTDRWGTSRTRSFRRSFLLAYASRIGERLHAATADAVQRSSEPGALVPLLDRRREQVDGVRDELFPHAVHRATTISNGLGWAEGRAAADLALLDAHLRCIGESA